MKLYIHEIEIFFNGKPNTARVKEHNILAQNDEYLVIDNKTFTTYQFKKDKIVNIYSVIDEISVMDWSNDRVFGKLYLSMATMEPDFKKIRNKMANKFDKWLYEKHGRFVDRYTSLSSAIKLMEPDKEDRV